MTSSSSFLIGQPSLSLFSERIYIEPCAPPVKVFSNLSPSQKTTGFHRSASVRQLCYLVPGNNGAGCTELVAVVSSFIRTSRKIQKQQPTNDRFTLLIYCDVMVPLSPSLCRRNHPRKPLQLWGFGARRAAGSIQSGISLSSVFFSSSFLFFSSLAPFLSVRLSESKRITDRKRIDRCSLAKKKN